MLKDINLRETQQTPLVSRKLRRLYHPARFASVSDLIDALGKQVKSRCSELELTCKAATLVREGNVADIIAELWKITDEGTRYLFMQYIYTRYAVILAEEKDLYSVHAQRLWAEHRIDADVSTECPDIFTQYVSFHREVMRSIYGVSSSI